MDISKKKKSVIDTRIRRIRVKKWIVSLVLSVVLTAMSVYVLFGVVFGISQIKGHSMEPALKSGDIVLFSRFSDIERGDIVLVSIKEEKSDYIKRIIGVPDDRIEIDNEKGKVLVNGQEIKEPYIYEDTFAPETDKVSAEPVILGPNEYYVLGDNRTNSKDSRIIGPINKSQIDGKVLFIFRKQ